MYKINEIENQILFGDCIEHMKQIPDRSIKLFFADPPYNLQLKKDLFQKHGTYKVPGVFEKWDQFESFQDYDVFTDAWLTEAKRVLTDDGTIWVCGTYHNIYRVGYIMQNMGFWFLNDIHWVKTNPMPNFGGTRFQSATESIIWAKKSEKSKFTFNYQDMKALNDDKQMRNDWSLPVCSGEERLKDAENKTLHSTQKPEAILYRVIVASSNPGDLILDPFSGTATTAVVSKKLRRKFIGIENDNVYYEASLKRLEKVVVLPFDNLFSPDNPKTALRVPIISLIESKFVNIGEYFYFKDKSQAGQLKANGKLIIKDLDENLSIHKAAAKILDVQACNGWDYWYVERDNKLISIDDLRKKYRKNLQIQN